MTARALLEDKLRLYVLQWRHNAQGCGRKDAQAAGAWRSCARQLETAIASSLAEQPAHSRAQGGGWEMVAIVCERGTVSWRAERILPVGTKLYTAAEQPAKGEGSVGTLVVWEERDGVLNAQAQNLRYEHLRSGSYEIYTAPQPSDPADADAL